MSAVVFVVSEDTGEHGAECVATLIRRLVPAATTHVPGDRKLLVGAKPGAWPARSGAEYSQGIRLREAIATELMRGRWVVFHYDADDTWKNRKQVADRHQSFDRYIRNRVAQILAPKVGDDQSRNAILERLLTMVPHYSIEAWLYQATQHVRERCGKECAPSHAAECAAHLAAWDETPAQLDEVHQPKELICIHDKHNGLLVSEVSLDRLRSFEKSFRAFEAKLSAMAGAA